MKVRFIFLIGLLFGGIFPERGLAWSGPSYWKFSASDILSETGFLVEMKLKLMAEKPATFTLYEDQLLKKEIKCVVPLSFRSEELTVQALDLDCGAELVSILASDFVATITFAGISKKPGVYEINGKNRKFWVSSKAATLVSYDAYLERQSWLKLNLASPVELKAEPKADSPTLPSPCLKGFTFWESRAAKTRSGDWLFRPI